MAKPHPSLLYHAKNVCMFGSKIRPGIDAGDRTVATKLHKPFNSYIVIHTSKTDRRRTASIKFIRNIKHYSLSKIHTRTSRSKTRGLFGEQLGQNTATLLHIQYSVEQKIFGAEKFSSIFFNAENSTVKIFSSTNKQSNFISLSGHSDKNKTRQKI